MLLFIQEMPDDDIAHGLFDRPLCFAGLGIDAPGTAFGGVENGILSVAIQVEYRQTGSHRREVPPWASLSQTTLPSS